MSRSAFHFAHLYSIIAIVTLTPSRGRSRHGSDEVCDAIDLPTCRLQEVESHPGRPTHRGPGPRGGPWSCNALAGHDPNSPGHRGDHETAVGGGRLAGERHSARRPELRRGGGRPPGAAIHTANQGCH